MTIPRPSGGAGRLGGGAGRGRREMRRHKPTQKREPGGRAEMDGERSEEKHTEKREGGRLGGGRMEGETRDRRIPRHTEKHGETEGRHRRDSGADREK